MLRDKSNLSVGLLLPIILILLFGYGLSFDVKNAPIAVVSEDNSPNVREIIAGLWGSRYLSPILVKNIQEAEYLLRANKADAIMRIPADFSRRLSMGEAHIQLILNGVNSTTAQTVEGYIKNMLALWTQRQADRSGNKLAATDRIQVVQRIRFNETSNSNWYLVPGLIALVMTLIGAFLTSLLIAREWEHGTLESLFVTPVRPQELLLAKLLPYLAIGAVDLLLCLAAAHFLFAVPMHGSPAIILSTSLLYLIVSLLMGLFISGKMRNQFQASQVALLVSFMPAIMLSGFIFDLRNVPLIIQNIAHLLPATHFMSLIKTLFLAGNHWPTILQSVAVLILYALILTFATLRTLRKTLE